MKLGINGTGLVGKASTAAVIEHAQQAANDGFASYWLVQLPTSGNDVLTAIALGGQKTSRIELGTAVVSAYARHPLTYFPASTWCGMAIYR